MTEQVIHFFRLPDLAGELKQGAVVRVEAVVKVEESSTSGLGRLTAQVHARAVAPAGILVFMVQVGTIQTIHGQPAKEDQADFLEDAKLAAERAVRDFLISRGLEIRPGLIDIGAAVPACGNLQGLEDPGGGDMSAGEDLPVGVEAIRRALAARGVVDLGVDNGG